jgi:hypothetical protein
MAFDANQRARIKHFLKYPDWQSMSNGVQMGMPAGAQAMYLVEQSFERLTAAGETSVLDDLEQCESCECQLKDARRRMRAKSVGTIAVNEREPNQIKAELEEWRQRLSDDLGAPINPYTLPNPFSAGGGINARVMS